MNTFNTILVLALAYLAVFGEAAFPLLRHGLGAQVDLLPGLMIYAALNTGILTIATLAILGGLWFDSLSANPLGITILPLFLVGMAVWLQREFILRELPFAQIVLGAIASAVVPALVVLLLLTGGKEPLLGIGSLWQWIVMTAGGAAATPLIFALLDWGNHMLGYQPRKETSFRSDREIRRDRKVK